MEILFIQSVVWILIIQGLIWTNIHGNKVNKQETVIGDETAKHLEADVRVNRTVNETSDEIGTSRATRIMHLMANNESATIPASVPSFNHTNQMHNNVKTGHTGIQTDFTELLPQDWQRICKMEYKFIAGSNFTAQNSFYVSCDLKETDDWSLYDYRTWVSTNQNLFNKYLPRNESLGFAFDLKCQNKNATVTMPWPAKAQYLWYISVLNCTVDEFLAEFDVNIEIPDVLRVGEFVDVDFKIDSKRSFQVLTSDFNTISKQFDCGSEVMERYVKRNCKNVFIKHKEESLNKRQLAENIANVNTTSATSDVEFPKGLFHFKNESEMLNAIAKIGQQNQKIEYRCIFKNFRYIDESCSTNVPKHYSHYMIERRHYPALEYFNLSHSKLTKISDSFLQWRRYFPKIKYVDFSHNKIKYFSTLSDHGLKSDPVGVIDLRHNNITTLTLDDLEALRIHRDTVYVDIRENPLNCDCKLTNFLNELKNSTSIITKKYEYLKEMKCSKPDKFKGQLVIQIEADLCEALEFIILVAPIAIVTTFFVILVTVLVLVIKCRKEIMILAFTRLNISLPCRKIMKDEDKAYDAFIAYSEADGDWVFDILLNRLEVTKENNGPGFKLCIHHRDFPVGGCIADNIVDKVKESHHTVLILSNNFLLSHWCKYEFKTALTQSVTEKKRHLIIIIKEELDKQLIDKDLNRCLKTFTFVKADDRLFWDKIIFALSDHERIAAKQQGNAKINDTKKIDNNVQMDNVQNNVRQNDNDAAIFNVEKEYHQQNGLQEWNNPQINQDIQQDGIWMV